MSGRLLLWLLALCVLSFGTTAAHAQELPREGGLGLEQPELLARRVADDALVGVYPGPDGAAEADVERLREVVHRAYRSVFGADARTELSGVSMRDLETLASEAFSESTNLVARQLELGRRLYRAGEIAEAIETLEEALASPQRPILALARPDIVAESLEVLALATQEALADGLLSDDQLEARLRYVLREWIRIRPGHRIDGRRYPMTFVEAWRQAYFDQLETSAALLAIRIDEARQVAAILDVDLFVDLRLLHGPRGSSVSVRLYDRVEDRFAYDALLAWDGSAEGLERVLSESFSAANACIPLRAPVSELERKRRVNSVWLYGGWTGFTFMQRPTNQLFFNQGAEAGLQVYFTSVVGMFIETQLAFSSRDRAGTLLRSVQMQGLSAGISLKYERPRYRLFLEGGPYVGRRSSVVVTQDFWCRVSGGDAFDFGPNRACDDRDISRSEGGAVMTINFRGGLSVRIAGSVWLNASIWTAMTVAPFEGRTLDVPVGGTLGAAVKF